LDSYVVHIYRREREQLRLSGLAERVHDGAKQGFGSADELWAFLLADDPSGEHPPLDLPSENEP
jgi:hypothetical protein